MGGVRFLLRQLRLLRRLLFLVWFFACAGLDHWRRGGRKWTPRERSLWQQRISRHFLKGMGFEVKVMGTPPEGTFIAPNHLGYVDIIALASVAPQVFLSRSDVARWPVIGYYTKIAGTLFIDRTRRGDVANRETSFAKVIEAGLNMTIFLEGTSSDGHAVLPFRSSLLEPVVKNQWPVTPAYLRYECDDGDPAQDVCWWGAMDFGPHLLRMCRVKRTRATIVFGKSRHASEDRKQLALDLYGDVQELARSLSPSPQQVASE